MRDEAQVAECLAERENRRYLPGHLLDPNVLPTSDLAGAVGGSDLIVVSVPSASFRDWFATGSNGASALRSSPYRGQKPTSLACLAARRGSLLAELGLSGARQPA